MEALKQFIKKYIEKSFEDRQQPLEPIDLSKFVINTSEIKSNIKIYFDYNIHEIFLLVGLKPMSLCPKCKIFIKNATNNEVISSFIYDAPIITSIDIEFLNYGFYEQNGENFTFFSNNINDRMSMNINDSKIATKNFPYINQDIQINITKNLSTNRTKQNGYDILFFPYGVSLNSVSNILYKKPEYVKFYGKTSVERAITNNSDFFAQTQIQLPYNGKYCEKDIFTEKFNFLEEDFNSLEEFVKNKNIKFETNTRETFASVDIINHSNNQFLIKFKNTI